ncbi:transporter substrate-binding domain-containing protein [Rheinheimera sp.]|uniref:substrate-binding periplasmic protein n=1 Tax=Rheinheimera sp. TaxID=1869214 RepID=UPI00307DEB77
MRLIILACFSFNLVAHPTLKAGYPTGFSDELPGKAGNSLRSQLLYCIEQRSNLHWSWQSYPTTRLFHSLASGDLDLVYPAIFSAERETYAIASERLFYVRNLWLSKASSPTPTPEKSIVVKRGSLQAEQLKERGFVKLVLVEDFRTQLDMLDAGRADLALIPEETFLSLQAQRKQRYSRLEFNKVAGGFYLSKRANTAFLPALNQAIQGCLPQFNPGEN